MPFAVKGKRFSQKLSFLFGMRVLTARHTKLEIKTGGMKMSKTKKIATTSLFAAISMAGAVGLLMSGSSTAPRRMVKRAGAMMSQTADRVQAMMHVKGKL